MSAQTEESKRYNGWANYETWVAGMFLDGNYTGEGTYRDTCSLVDLHREIEDPHEARRRLADEFKAYTDNFMPDLGASLAADLLGAAMSEIDWYELAESHLSD